MTWGPRAIGDKTDCAEGSARMAGHQMSMIGEAACVIAIFVSEDRRAIYSAFCMRLPQYLPHMPPALKPLRTQFSLLNGPMRNAMRIMWSRQ